MTEGKMFAEKNPWPEGAGLGTPLLLVENVSKSFAIRKGGFFGGEEKQVLAVDDVSFEVKRGECLGLVGESGCGKTTLSKIIMRALTPDAGRILFNEGSQADRDAEAEGRSRCRSSASASSSCSRIRWARSIRACRSTTSSPSRW